jgi:hypothetical protein
MFHIPSASNTIPRFAPLPNEISRDQASPSAGRLPLSHTGVELLENTKEDPGCTKRLAKSFQTDIARGEKQWPKGYRTILYFLLKVGKLKNIMIKEMTHFENFLYDDVKVMKFRNVETAS